MTYTGTSSAATYDGKVTSGGPAQVRSLGSLEIRKIQLGGMANNAYLLIDTDESARDGAAPDRLRPAILIDAAADWPRLNSFLQDARVHVETVVTTHRHGDHTGALADAVAATGARTAAGEDDADQLPVAVDIRLQDGDTIPLGRHLVDVIALRGHTPGSVALAVQDDDGRTHLFTGDSLFPGGVGATDRFDYQSFPQLFDDVRQRVFDRFDDDTWVYPGHGDDTTLGAERPHLNEWKERGW